MDKKALKLKAKKISKEIENFFQSGNYKEHKLIFFSSLALVILLLISSTLLKPEEKPQSEYRELVNIPTIKGSGYIRDLDLVMKEDNALRRKVGQLWDYKRNDLFFNYQKVNSDIVEIIFRWSGITSKQLKQIDTATGVDFFLRQAYGFNMEENIKGHPLMGKRPWPTMFNHFKARLLMLGAGKEIYDGYASYNTQKDRIEIEGNLSKEFIQEFKKFLKGRTDRDRYVNNFISFVDKTKGVKNLSKEDYQILKELKAGQ